MSGGPVVIGLDLSLTASAVASSRGWVQVTGTTGKNGATYRERFTRIGAVTSDVVHLISPDAALIVVEGPAYSRNDPSAFDRAHLWWRVYDYLHSYELPVAVVSPTSRAMYATGRGNAGKGAVIDAVARRWPQYLTDGDDNAADAVVLMAMGLDQCGYPLSPVPETHRRALVKVAWPDSGPWYGGLNYFDAKAENDAAADIGERTYD